MIQLLAVDALGRTQGGSAVVEATAGRDNAANAVREAQTTFDRLTRELAALRTTANTIASTEANRNRLTARNMALSGEDTTLTSDEGRLTGSGVGSIVEAQTALNAALAPPADNAPATSAEQDALRANQIDELRVTITSRQSELQRVRARRLAIAEETARNNAELAALTDATPAPDLTAMAMAVSTAQSNLEQAQATLAMANTSLATAREGVGPGFSGTQALAKIIERTFDETGQIGAGRASQSACIQWFARNPQVKVKANDSTSETTLVTSENKGIPAIALFCSNLLDLGRQTTANRFSNRSNSASEKVGRQTTTSAQPEFTSPKSATLYTTDVF